MSNSRFGTRVSYRLAGHKNKIATKDFFGEYHSEQAQAFVREHVGGLTEEEWAKLPKAKQARYVSRRFVTPSNMANAVTMYTRRVPLWNWHSVEPIEDLQSHAT